ncbi:MAG: M24 family metallopeptidase [Clostridium sp.]|nr:M24 family metallopeptidase [Clostridium sp.]
MKIEYSKVKAPEKDCAVPVPLSDETIIERKSRVLEYMNEKNLDKLVIYGDVEHGYNFMYLVGYFTRFEEGLLVIDRSGEMTLMLGNENLNKCSKARVSCDPVHVSLFSLPNQPNRKDCTLEELMVEAGIGKNQKIGIVGWKHFTSQIEECRHIYDIPSYIVDTIRKIAGDDSCLSNETEIFIGENGVRTINNANEIAHYEFGAALASDCMLDAMDLLECGVSEFELGDALTRYGQHTNVVTIAASGARFVKGNMFPTANKVKIGDTISLTVGYAGGSSSRAGYAVSSGEELPEGAEDYMDRIAVPYYRAYASWLENIHIGMKGDEMFQGTESVLPREEYHWSLCPGHLTAEEEWMSSPIYEGSQEVLKSGMIFQIDIIPSVSGLGGVSAESTVVLADEKLKDDIRREYPEMWERMQKRIEYIRSELHINLSQDVLPMCSTVAYLRPYLLNKDHALVVCKA